MTRIRRHRLLPITGRVLVRKSQVVSAIDVIAEANQNPKHVLLDIARGLGVGISEVDQHLQREAGNIVAEGDVLAGPVGWGKRVVRAPCSGKIILTGRGKLLLEEEEFPYQVLAGLPGEVISLIPGRGAVIESIGALAQGVWGNGQINFGLLRVLIKKVEDILTVEQLDIDLRGTVVFAGYCGDEQVLLAAAELPLKGLILIQHVGIINSNRQGNPYTNRGDRRFRSPAGQFFGFQPAGHQRPARNCPQRGKIGCIYQ